MHMLQQHVRLGQSTQKEDWGVKYEVNFQRFHIYLCSTLVYFSMNDIAIVALACSSKEGKELIKIMNEIKAK